MRAIVKPAIPAIIIFFLCASNIVYAAVPNLVHVGIVTDGPWMRYTEARETLKKEIMDVTSSQFDVRFPSDLFIQGDWSVTGINNAIDRLLENPEVDLVITLGRLASSEVCKRRNLAKPVIAPMIVDARIQKLPEKNGTSGIKNLVYIDSQKDVVRTIKTFRETMLFDHLTIMESEHVVEGIPEIAIAIEKMMGELDLTIDIVSVDKSIDDAFSDLSPSTQAVIVKVLPQISADDFDRLVQGLMERRLPSFSTWGRDEVEQGILASVVQKDTLDHLARMVAVNVLSILEGMDAGSLPVVFKPSEQLTINMATARTLDVYPSLITLTEADLINEEKVSGRLLTMEKTIQEAILVNLDLAAADRALAAGEEQVVQARSSLLPQIDLGVQGIVVDQDRAEASLGIVPERSVSGGATLLQSIYVDETWAGYDVEKYLQNSRVEGREALRLDITREAANAYLEVLNTRTRERIQKDNLKLTRANLERARQRVSVGAAGPEEIYRWETEIAGRKRAVLASESLTLDAMNSLNRILNRPLREPFMTQDVNTDDPLFGIIDDRFGNYVNNQRSLNLLRDFLIQEGILVSPELRGLDAQIAAEERTYTSAKRTQWLPDFILTASLKETFNKSGAGSDPITTTDDTRWSVGAFAKYPLYQGGQVTATKRRSLDQLNQLEIQRRATAERIEERILFAVNLIRTSYPSIQLTSEASIAANKNLELVTASYERGIKSIIDLIDAQNSALTADISAASAVYNFLLDLTDLQRAMGEYNLYTSLETRTAWLDRLDEYFEKMESSQ